MSSSQSDTKFRCPVDGCVKEYAKKDKLKGHLERSHSVSQEDLQSQLENVSAYFLCDVSFADGTLCGKSFSSKQKRNAHMKRHTETSVPSTETPVSQPPPPPSNSASSSSSVSKRKPKRPLDHNILWTDELRLADDDTFERELHQLWFRMSTRPLKTNSSLSNDGKHLLSSILCVVVCCIYYTLFQLHMYVFNNAGTRYMIFTCCVNGDDQSMTADDQERKIEKRF
eukprot:CAMPEP_0184352096 /NCGR_PEP_ID=MMETSP1089-20130417/60316_1 /TAXON_ID=38269 ORGANISM="Gloeochaete wittrockiana, Strain SAG46.84" /NCGR_SAMPLE_ID=MMETSP1089 /ASSEMBLY_ACC=CAM_ASM_000445 /LENGTH=225 /DNA_ID=CAMNT_0026686187 /DNA_START=159 /DNA_END=833 /DNA_ORIENTATION=+